HRIGLREGKLRDTIEENLGELEGAPSLIIDTHVDHGLLPLTSMSRDSGSLKPGLANTVSTMKLDPGNGQLIDIPGRIYSDVGLTGEKTSRYLLEAGSREFDGSTLEWQGADVTVHTNPATGAVSVKGEVQAWSLVHGRGDVRFGGITIEGDQRKSRYGFSVGSIELEAGPVEMEDSAGPGGSIRSLSIDASSEIDGDRLNGLSKLEITGVRAPELGDIDVAMEIVFNGLDARSFQKIVKALRATRGSADPEHALANIYPEIEPDLQEFLAAGAEVRLDRLDVTLPAGPVTTKLRLDVPAAKPDAEFSWPALLLALDASADIRLPVELVEMAQTVSPEAGSLVAMGFLRKDGDFYEMRAEYAKGLLTVNGAPMPIPLPGL
ncbi:MAG: DUF945 family protein, partial [Woeseiaceae bacterium]